MKIFFDNLLFRNCKIVLKRRHKIDDDDGHFDDNGDNDDAVDGYISLLYILYIMLSSISYIMIQMW